MCKDLPPTCPTTSAFAEPAVISRPRIAALAVVIALQVALVATPALGSPSRRAPHSTAASAVVREINAIRRSFGLVSGRNTTAYTAEVLQAVNSNEDPPYAPFSGRIVAEESLWGLLPGPSASGAATAVSLVDDWVYRDDWGGSTKATWNADCTAPGAPACDAHRRAVLSTVPTPGARLAIDVTVQQVSFAGLPSLAVAALLVWKTPA